MMKSVIEKLARKIGHLLHPVVGEIWCLHRVVPQRSRFISNRELEITPECLERLITRYLQDGYEFVSLDAVVASVSSRKLFFAQHQVSISFDDGFQDIYTHAFPIFLRYQIPFTIYLTTDFPDQKADMWWLKMETAKDSW
ncbi:MAG: polysaccharide deacetylase family protein [Erysipelotrichaceae bacterium]|nr:polysaccharide deacetylase family protein [Erysipelotrichaceae bacterium]